MYFAQSTAYSDYVDMIILYYYNFQTVVVPYSIAEIGDRFRRRLIFSNSSAQKCAHERIVVINTVKNTVLQSQFETDIIVK